MKRIRVSGPAERDLDDIWLYVATTSQSPTTADKVVDSITDTFVLFSRNPGIGANRDEVDPGVRGFPVGQYVVYYRETPRSVVISRVIHGMRDQRAAFTS
jgi:toxin ParE1/3/4